MKWKHSDKPPRWRVTPTEWVGAKPWPRSMKLEAGTADDAFWLARAVYAKGGCAITDADITIMRRSY